MSHRPNVLMIAFDDLNDWIGCLAGHPQTRTPNLDRLAAGGTLFTNAHCQAPICHPSRTSLLFGLRPSTSGVYDNGPAPEAAAQRLRETCRTLPAYFRDHGYRTVTAGKVFHNYTAYNDDFDVVGPQPGYRLDIETPKRTDLEEHVHTFWDFGPQDFAEHEFIDHRVASWAADRLTEVGDPDRPFFMAIGMAKPHTPFFSPRRHYEASDLAGPVVLPTSPGPEQDRVPASVREVFYSPHPPTHSWMEADPIGRWQEAVRCYLACIRWVDEQIGRMLDALEAGPHAGDTVVVLWSDHGMHLGEKRHWAKWTLWERSTHVPLIVSVPGGPAGQRCDRPVENLSVYPTLVDLCGLPRTPQTDGQSLVPLLESPGRDWPHPAITTLYAGNHSIRTDHHRYISYAHGYEELFDHRLDPGELHNRAGETAFDQTLEGMRRCLP